MIQGKRILALIPARAGSKGLPGKNIKNLCGKPLIAWPIQAALKSKYIDDVVVSTDSQEIAVIAQKFGAEIPFIRPKKYALDTSPSSDFILHAFDALKKQNRRWDYFVLLEPTSPLTESQDIDAALEKLMQCKGKTIVSVAQVEVTHPIFCTKINNKGKLIPYDNKVFDSPKRRQEMEDVYFFDGSLYISEIETYKESKTFYHKSTLPFIMPSWKALDIDTYLDFLMIETIIKNKSLLEKDDLKTA